MSTTKLEDEISTLREQLTALQERVRLTAVAEKFLAGDHEIRDDDFVRFPSNHAARIHISAYSGKWTYADRHGSCIEPFRVPPEDGIERLYTIAEVAEILARHQVRNVPGVRFTPIDPEDDGGVHMTWDEFASGVRSAAFTDDDGFGEYATLTHVADMRVRPSTVSHNARPDWATHVVWYNK